jgi:hypothetical protein
VGGYAYIPGDLFPRVALAMDVIIKVRKQNQENRTPRTKPHNDSLKNKIPQMMSLRPARSSLAPSAAPFPPPSDSPFAP